MASNPPEPERRRPATQEDVARLAGVSTATVSHVLTGRTERMTEATRQRVLEAIRTLGYKTPPLDPRFLGPHTQNIGILAPDLTTSPIFSNLYFGSILDSALEACLLQGWGVTIMAERMWDDAGRSIRRTYDGRCDGILAVAPENDSVVARFAERGVPVVQVGTSTWHASISSVDIDNASVGRQVAERFVGLGHTRLGFIGSGGSVSSHERRDAYVEAAERLGATVLVHEFNTTETPEEYTAMLAGSEPPTALFCWNEGTALHAYRTAARVGLRIPEDLSVIAVDDERGETVDPPLDTFHQPIREIGRRAVEILLDQIRSGATAGEKILLEAEPVFRRSVTHPRKTIG
ncbi:MAG: LacI family DNA-binding transcriptional regulator [Fimbriimonas sp.]